MQNKITFTFALISFFCISLQGMSKNEYETVPGIISMEAQDDCNNCWGNEKCYDSCQKVTSCLGAPFVGCFCCFLAICGGTN